MERSYDELLHENERLTALVARHEQPADRGAAEDPESAIEIISVTAHQLRTPLAAVRWATQALLDGEYGTLTPEQYATLVETQHHLRRMVHLTDNLLAARHLDASEAPPVPPEINLTLVIKEVLDSMQSAIVAKRIAVTFDHPEGTPKLRADAEQMKDVFFNLLDNALKYTPAGGRVIITLRTTEQGITVTVADTGIGIPAAYLPKVFNRFVRAENAARVDPDGSGLGLYIVAKTIAANGGKITVESTEGQGTTFTVTLPQTAR